PGSQVRPLSKLTSIALFCPAVMNSRFVLAGAAAVNVTVCGEGSVRSKSRVGRMTLNGTAGAMLTLSQCQVFGGQFASPTGLWTTLNASSSAEHDFSAL